MIASRAAAMLEIEPSTSRCAQGVDHASRFGVATLSGTPSINRPDVPSPGTRTTARGSHTSGLHRVAVPTVIAAATCHSGTCDCTETTEEWYRRHRTMIWRYVFGNSGDHTLADDYTNETFLRAFRRRHTYRCYGNGVLPWLVTIARNVVLDAARGPRTGSSISSLISLTLAITRLIPSMSSSSATNTASFISGWHPCPGTRQPAYGFAISKIIQSRRRRLRCVAPTLPCAPCSIAPFVHSRPATRPISRRSFRLIAVRCTPHRLTNEATPAVEARLG